MVRDEANNKLWVLAKEILPLGLNDVLYQINDVIGLFF